MTFSFKTLTIVLLAGTTLGLCGQARAEVINYNSGKPWYDPSEVSLGAGATDPTMGKELSPDIVGEIALQPVGNSSWYNELRVRPTAGFSANTGGRTSYGYVGATFDLLNFDNFFFDGFFGMSAHDGELHPNFYEAMDHRALGSRFEFRSAAALGYQFTPNYAFSVTIDHQSNAGILSDTNQGIETVDARFSYLFP